MGRSAHILLLHPFPIQTKWEDPFLFPVNLSHDSNKDEREKLSDIYVRTLPTLSRSRHHTFQSLEKGQVPKSLRGYKGSGGIDHL